MKTKLIIAFSAITLLQGCLAAAAITGAEGVKTMAQERSVGDRIDDNGIALRINDKFIQKDIDNLFTDISTAIFEGRVMLTGGVKKPEYKAKAEQLVWEVNGVVEVINEVQVSQTDLIDYSKDIYLANAVRGKALLTKGIKSSNFQITSVNSIIYLLGVAQNQQESANVIEIARRIKGVQKVVSHVILTDDPRRIKWANQK